MPYRRKCLLAVLAALGIGSAPTVQAQQDKAVRPTQRTRPAADVLAMLGQSAGVVVLADSTILGRLRVPSGGATPETIEQQITDIVRVLPAGTTWAKLYVPAPAKSRWDAEAVAEFARAQARQLGTTVGGPTPAGTVELLGQRMPAEKAKEHIAALNLKLVYLVTNPRVQAAVLAMADWHRLTPAQREASTRQQAQRILALDPASRLQLLARLMETAHDTPEQTLIQNVIQRLSEDERRQLKETFGREVGGGATDREGFLIEKK